MLFETIKPKEKKVIATTCLQSPEGQLDNAYFSPPQYSKAPFRVWK